MNTNTLHQSIRPSSYTYSQVRRPYDIRHVLKQSKLVLQPKGNTRYRPKDSSLETPGTEHTAPKTPLYHRKLMLSQ